MPLINILAIVIVALPAFLWATKGKGRGFFSAFLAFLCTVAAGAIAFAVWEPLVYGLLLERMPNLAWGLGLLVPFLLSLAVLRVVVDQVVKANLDFDDVTNFVGGLLFGAASGYVAAGIVVLSIGFFRMPASTLGYSLLEQEQGSFVVKGPLWIRADEVVAGAFEHLSRGAFATGTPLAVYMPNAHIQAAAQRQAFYKEDDGKRYLGKTTVSPDSVNVAGHYVIEGPLESLLSDSAQPDRRQEVRYVDGTRPSSGAALHGFVVQFDSRAQETSGQVLVGPGQLRLLAQVGSEVYGFFPVAIVATPDAQAGGLYRFRMDASDIHIASVGGGASTEIIAEYLLPPNARPLSMLVKNARVELEGDLRQGRPLASVEDRDAMISTGELIAEFGGGGATRVDVTQLDRTGAITIARTEDGRRLVSIEESTYMPGGRTLNRGNRGSLVINERNRIVDGSQKFRPQDFRNRGTDRDLIVQDFMTSADTTLVQLTLTEDGNFNPIATAIDRGDPSQPLYLIDEEGRRFQAIGFFYEDGSLGEIRFTPGRPLQSLRDYPEISVAKRDQTLVLFFRPTKGVNIRYIAVGDRIVAEIPAGGLDLQAPR